MAYKVYVCGPTSPGPQCGYVSYLAGMEYGPKRGPMRVPMHTHLKANGSWLETAWGAADKCKYPKRRPDLAVEARNEQ